MELKVHYFSQQILCVLWLSQTVPPKLEELIKLFKREGEQYFPDRSFGMKSK